MPLFVTSLICGKWLVPEYPVRVCDELAWLEFAQVVCDGKASLAGKFEWRLDCKLDCKLARLCICEIYTSIYVFVSPVNSLS